MPLSAQIGLCPGCQMLSPIVSTILDLVRVMGPTLVTVLLGALVIQRYFVSRSNQAAFIDLMVRELDGLRDDSLEYWTLHADSEDGKNKETILAQKIKGAIRCLSADMHYFCDRYCKGEKSKVDELLMEISDACTGGTFESSPKPTDNGRYLLVVNAINRTRSELFKRKI